MGLYKSLPEEIREVDILVVGGGAAGCIVAGRLAEADPSLSVLVVESGPDNYGDPAVVVPAFWLSHMDPNDKFILPYKSSASSYLAGREVVVPTSRVLGGGSSVNMLLYSRPQRSELDAWGTPGWSADEILEYMNKLESYHGPGLKERHGHDGPIYVGPGNYRSSKLESDFINSTSRCGWPEVEDINNLDTINGSMRALRYVSPDGKREDVAHKYLHPKLRSDKFPNLHVLVETDIERVLFDDEKHITGVTFRPCPKFQPDREGEPVRSIKVRKTVVLSAGALGTPGILERSGIGSPRILERAQILLVATVPGVGENYQDHHIMLYPYKANLGPHETMDELLGGRLDVGELISKNDPILSYNGVDVQCKLRPSTADVVSLGPEFEAAWNKDFKDYPDKPMMIISPVACFPGDPSSVPVGQYFGIATFSLHPYSRGRIHISGPDISDEIFMDAWADPNELDLKKHVWMYKKQREIVRRMDAFDGEIAAGHPQFPSGSKAATADTKAKAAQDVYYTSEDDKAIENWLRDHVASCWHSMGTCKMAPFDDGGVVDPNLNVYGVRGLKVADLSIVPSNLGANTCSTAMAIGEKAADIVIQELGIAR
ncbi:Alcohol oxidase [Diaporthe amygdali]|uniref:Alcohol oxidase n=1 Tax=Phomopsis amygdali TaxID=1214568 RepID=UPI0022FF2942|nr:Alcohol oxidase [Diaporthe amygdali]KAJ0120117.1 Alcohol oxidase [Diaporthe amygdali]